MDIDLQRKIDRYVGGALCRLLSWCRLPWRRRRAPASVDRILVILLSEMGSLVLAAPMFQRLRERYPHAALHVLLFKKNREVLDLLGAVPPENVWTLDSAGLGPLLRDGWRLLRGLRRARFDVVIDCELFARVSSILSCLSGAPLRVGFHRHTQEGLYRGDFINRPVLYNPYHHLSQQFLTLAEAIDSPSHPKAKRLIAPRPFRLPKLAIPAAETQALRRRLLSGWPQLTERRLVLIYPSGGLLPIRAWPEAHYLRVARALLDRGYAVGIIGMPADRPQAERIQTQCRHDDCIDLTGFTDSVRELMVLFGLSSLLITNDGGPGQFAALSDVPTIIFYGPETPVLYGSLDPEAVVLFSGASCAPCVTAYNHRKSPCDGDNVCLQRIRPEEVLTKAWAILAADRRVPLGEPREAPAPPAPRIVDVPAPPHPATSAPAEA